MLFLNSVKDAFTNPDSPWYYAIGSVFLVLIIVAIVVYMVVSKKRAKKSDTADTAENIDKADTAENVGDAENADTTENVGDAENADNKDISETDEVACDEPVPAAEVETQDDSAKEPAPIVSENPAEEPIQTAEEPTAGPEKPVAEEHAEKEAEHVDEIKEPESAQDEPITEPAPKPKKAPVKKPATKKTEPAAPAAPAAESESATEPVPAKKPAAKKPAAKKAADKPFIDRLIATKPAHGVYNELKNTILSYPGMKAKLTKDDEQFFFGTDKKAAISLDGETVTLKLGLARDKVPSQFAVTDGDGDLPTAMVVGDTEIDAAQRLITFTMNVSLLTRNDRHRHTDYIQKAIDAKTRAKKK